jgi:hypothetical protein
LIIQTAYGPLYHGRQISVSGHMALRVPCPTENRVEAGDSELYWQELQWSAQNKSTGIGYPCALTVSGPKYVLQHSIAAANYT